MTLEQAAWGIHAMVNLQMELATRVVSIERGHDPRSLALVATGGCGPTHACRLVAQLGVRTVVLPAAAGVASAIGLLTADVRLDVSRSRLAPFPGDAGQAERLLAEMEREAEELLGGRPVAFTREVDLRYAGQGYELTVPYEDAREAFEDLYARRYGLASPGEPLEATTWRVAALGETPAVDLPTASRRPEPTPCRRRAYVPETGGYDDVLVLVREELGAAHRVEGPAIVEERESTAVLPPGVTATVDEHGSLLVELPA
jgi:N-methylhydantoinase A/oxoprolinase/acetone carboxylase beta subunit